MKTSFKPQGGNLPKEGHNKRLKKLAADSAKCTGCGVCQEVCSKAWYKTTDKSKGAIRIHVDPRGGYTVAVCDQCGACKEMCSVMALSTGKDGVVRLNKKSCVGCLVCVGECLSDNMRYHDDLPTPYKCVACGLCAKECPAGVLTVVEGEC